MQRRRRPAASASTAALGRLVINEIDYDQVGADTGGFVEIANTGGTAAVLDGIALVLVNGGDGTEYERVALTGSLAAGGHLLIDVDAQNGAPDGVALIDTAPGRSATRSRTKARSPPPPSADRSTTSSRAPCSRRASRTRTPLPARSRGCPDGTDTDDAASDWKFTTTATPGGANVSRRSLPSRLPPRPPSPGAGALALRSRSSAPQLLLELAVASPAFGVQRPSASAAWIAHPGSPSWRQSEKRHFASNSTTSSNASSRPSVASQSWSSRIPGLSTISPPPGRMTSWRRVVVWRPAPSSRTSLSS